MRKTNKNGKNYLNTKKTEGVRPPGRRRGDERREENKQVRVSNFMRGRKKVIFQNGSLLRDEKGKCAG